MRIAAFLPALLLAIPAATAAMEMEADVTFAADFTSMDIQMSMSMGGEQAAQMRGAFDQMGNQDGRASQSEADAFLQQFRDTIEGSVTESMDPRDVTMDGNPAKGFEIEDLTMTDVDGPVTSESPITMSVELKVELEPEGDGEHTLVMKDSGDEGEEAEVTGQLRIRAPKGYVIKSHNAPEGSSLSSDKRILTVTESDAAGSGEDARIVFAPASASGSPAPAAGVLVALLGAAAVGTRRRRM
jgi:hypothetical protein